MASPPPAPQYSTFNVNEGIDFSASLGSQLFNAAIIDNYSNSWMYLPAANRYIPPFKHGFIATFLSGTQVALIQWRTPPGIAVPTTGNTGVATVVYTTAHLSQSNGTNITQPQQQELATSTGFTSALAVGGTAIIVAAVAKQRIIVFGWTVTFNPTTAATTGKYHLYLEGANETIEIANGQLLWGSDAGAGSLVLQGSQSLGIPLGFNEALQIRNNAASAGSMDVIGAVQYTQQ